MSYVYRHIRLDTNEVFYVGIGSDDTYRRANNKTLRSDFWKRIAEKTDYEVEIMMDGIDRSEALEKEIEFIQLYGRRDLGKGTLVNLSDGGDGGGKGWIAPPETIQKMRESSAKRNLTPELREKFATGKNRIKSEEERAKLSAAHKGRPKSEEHRRNLSIAKAGIKPSEETRKKLSEARKWRVITDEMRSNLSKALTGKKHSLEHRKNNAISNYKHSPEDVFRIKKMYASGCTCKAIGEMYGVSKSSIHLIVSGKSYKHYKSEAA